MRKTRTRASALLIVLAAIVLVSTIVLAFYIQSTLSRQISFSSSAQFRAEKISDVAFDTIINDLKAEITAGSVKTTVGTNSVYVPTTNFTIVPFRSGDQGFANLVKKSVAGAPFWTNTGTRYAGDGPIRATVPALSTATASANGRKVDKSRWNASYLLGDALPANFTEPDWILVSRSGVSASATAPAMTSASDSKASNANFIVGRYAYTVFDEGGLLDVNVAGFPSGVSADFVAKRGLLPQVDLANIPGFDATIANNLVKWRNQQSASDAVVYADSVYSSADGFTKVKNGDQLFISRKDLIGYVKKNAIPTSTLQYLGTFSRELNAPSFTPDPARKKVGNASFNPNTQGKDNDYNPSLINSRVTKTFNRTSDSTEAAIGEPLLKYRFPLSRLAWIGRQGPHAATAKQVADSFGLKYELSPEGYISWSYIHGVGDQGKTILTLAQVSQEGREPDFFELLQAAIHLGSLAKGSPFDLDKVASPPQASDPDLSSWYQLMQIGANLIDQYDFDSYPTRIIFDGRTFIGVENLPYLSRISETPLRVASNGVGIWYQPEVWNPHARAGAVAPAPSPMPTPPPSTGSPTQFRFTTHGRAYAAISADGQFLPATSQISSPPNDFLASPGVTFSTSSAEKFSEPRFLKTSMGASPDTEIPGSGGYAGILVGYAPDVPDGVAWSKPIPSPRVTHQLEYFDPDINKFVPYSYFTNIRDGLALNDGNSFLTFLIARCSIFRVDPRVERFGVVGGIDARYPTFRPDAGEGRTAHVGLGAGFQGWTLQNAISSVAAGDKALGYLSENKSSSRSFYLDPDLTQRRADGAYTAGSGLDGLPMAVNNMASRPIILDRPFRSVGEMAYASRGGPWKSLDFFTAESGDSALLDVFCINESSSSPILAGRVDLNTRQTPVLAAVLQGAIVSELDNTTISKTDANNLATSLVTRTSGTSSGAGPLLNRNELVTKWAQELVYSSSSDTIIKARRESAIRALADVGMTRSWNLLIDVIAQSGRYGTTAKNQDQFIVEGEKRFWMHVAIDRFSGKVISSFLEPIYE